MALVIEMTDRAFAIAQHGKLLEASDSVVRTAGAHDGRPGEPMSGRSRLVPTEVSSDHWAQIAAQSTTAGGLARAVQTAEVELVARLARAGLQTPQAAEVIVSAAFGPLALRPILSLLGSAGLRVVAFRDAAVTVAAVLDLPGELLVVELGLHHVAATRVSRRGAAFVRNGNRIDWQAGGWQQLLQQWLDLAAQALVLRTRFDPLHDARTEQLLYDALPAALRAATDHAVANVALRTPGGEHVTVQLTRDQLALPAQACMRATATLLHSLRPAGADITLVLPALMARLPGVDSLLADFAGCELLTIEDGFAAVGLSGALSDIPAQHWGPLESHKAPLIRRYPQALISGGFASTSRRIGTTATRIAPTHLLHEGRAIAISAQTIEIGRAASGVPGIALPEGLAAVSRLHCSLRREDGQVVLIDHSRYGTFVNGEKVAGSAILRAGDRVRIGDPGVELAMIAVSDNNAPPPTN